MVEVNFTTSPLGDRYMALIQSTAVIGTSYVSEVLSCPHVLKTSPVLHPQLSFPWGTSLDRLF